ncbi:MAG: hypothetical protein AAFZ49_13030, partial [Cyanobacteria bacterium J06659_2]
DPLAIQADVASVAATEAAIVVTSAAAIGGLADGVQPGPADVALQGGAQSFKKQLKDTVSDLALSTAVEGASSDLIVKGQVVPMNADPLASGPLTAEVGVATPLAEEGHKMDIARDGGSPKPRTRLQKAAEIMKGILEGRNE